MLTARYFDRYEGIDGGKFVFWLIQHKAVAKFIKQHKIPAVDRELLPMADVHMPHEAAEDVNLFIKRIPFPGGIRIAHLHFKGELYLLTREQWREFSGAAIREFRQKMKQANDVNFSQLMEISEAVNGLV